MGLDRYFIGVKKDDANEDISSSGYTKMPLRRRLVMRVPLRKLCLFLLLLVDLC